MTATVREGYKQHRMRVQNATSIINSQAPKPKPTSDDLKNMSYIQMMKALVNSGKRRSNFNTTLKSQENCKHYPLDLQQITSTNSKDYPIPLHIWQRYDHLDFVQEWNLMQKILRPNIYLDLTNGKDQPLGRLVIQLFTEACPEVVLQFVRACVAKQNSQFNISRLLFPLWMEAELNFDDKNALTAENLEHDSMAINHGTSAGVLSFPSRYLRGSKLRFITFTISFTPINVLNGKRIAFGIIKCGHKVLERIQNFEVTRCGRPYKSVTVSACGTC